MSEIEVDRVEDNREREREKERQAQTDKQYWRTSPHWHTRPLS